MRLHLSTFSKLTMSPWVAAATASSPRPNSRTFYEQDQQCFFSWISKVSTKNEVFNRKDIILPGGLSGLTEEPWRTWTLLAGTEATGLCPKDLRLKICDTKYESRDIWPTFKSAAVTSFPSSSPAGRKAFTWVDMSNLVNSFYNSWALAPYQGSPPGTK